MKDLLTRFVIGGAVVSIFSLISDLLKPKSFAGLFGAAPSVALASLTLTVILDNKIKAALEARSMILGAVALLIYSVTVSYLVLRFRLAALPVCLTALLLWLGAAFGLWYAILSS